MTTKRNSATHIRNGREPPASPASGAPAPTGRRRRMFGAAALGVATLTAVGALAGGLAAGGAHAGVLTNCAATPSSCGYPDATNTGVPSWHDPEVGPRPGLQRAGLVLQRRGQ